MKIEPHAYDFLRERKIQGSSVGSNRFRVGVPQRLNAWKKGHLKLGHLIICQPESLPRQRNAGRTYHSRIDLTS